MGEFFRKALISFNTRTPSVRLRGRSIDARSSPQTFTTYTIKADASLTSAILPTAHRGTGKAKVLPYTSLLEFVAERYHSAETYIQKLNPGMDWEHLEPGDELRVQTSSSFEIEKITEQKIRRNLNSLRAKFMSIPKSGCLKRSNNDKLFAFVPDHAGSTALPAPVGTGKFKARRRGPVSL